MIDTVSTTGRLTSRVSGFKTSNEVAAAITGGVAVKLADVLVAALGPFFVFFSGEDVTAIFELYKATPSVATMANAVKVPEAPDSVAEQQESHPPSPYEAGGDEAAGSPAASVKPALAKKECPLLSRG